MHKSIIGDFHLHSDFSGDSDSPMESMVQSAIEKGLQTICITEHLDKDYPSASTGLDFSLDISAYENTLLALKDKYASHIQLLFGIELGLQPHLQEYYQGLVQQYPFDFIIGSSHLVHGEDPYYPEFFQRQEESAGYLEYFESILENLDAFSNVDVYGHIDYIVRYGPNKNRDYSYEKYKDVLDEILKTIIKKDLGIECNTGGIKYGLGHPNPCEEILTRYRQLGGEILTIGSDAHQPCHVAYAFDQIPELLKSCGFKYYTVFKNRQPQFIKL